MDPGLVFDVGMHLGEDTAYYLSRGFRVVGVEANPTLVSHLRDRFASEVKSGRVHIVDRAISDTPGTVRFTTIADATLWGTAARGFALRSELQGLATDSVEVESVRFQDLLAECGTPYYLKVDIEGMDLCCFEALRSVDDRPPFVSLESVVTSLSSTPRDTRRELALLRELGYRRFAYVEQGSLDALSGTHLSVEGTPVTYRYVEHSSGPFGAEIPSRWRSFAPTLTHGFALNAYHWVFGDLGGQRRPLVLRAIGRGLRQSLSKLKPGLVHHRWYDLHARLDD